MNLIDDKTSTWIIVICAIFIFFMLGCVLRGACFICDVLSCFYKTCACFCRCCCNCNSKEEDQRRLVN